MIENTQITPSTQKLETISTKSHFLTIRKYQWLICSAVTFLSVVIVTHSVGSTSAQIQLAEGIRPQGSTLYLELATQDVSQFLGLTLESLALLAFMALLMERALEVFVVGFRSQNKMHLERDVRYWKRVVEDAKEEQGNEETACSIQKHTAESELKRIQELLTQEKATTKTQIQLIALLIGVMLGIAGIRVLEPLFAADSLLSMPNIQQIIFRFLDISITGLAVAGGSDGIHLISKRLGESFGQGVT